MKKLFIISNESVFNYEGKFFCDNLDLKSTPEGLSNNFNTTIIARKSNKVRSHNINLKKINIFSNVISFLHAIIKTINKEDSKYLVISISPFTFFACIVLKIFKKNPIVYLRSDGYSEYKAILGFAGPYIYHIMYSIISKISLLISCRDYILRGKRGEIVSPSQISKVWMENLKEQSINEIKLLYVGRIRVEKGIFSLLKILKQSNQFTLSIVGAEKTLDHKIIQNNVNVYEIENNERKLIQFYDDHNIFVLPSFTEGHPMVLLEALSRLRPVIIFEEIKHIIGDKRGIFVAKRNTKSFCETIEHIKINYAKIQKDMKQNQLPTKEIFLKKFSAIISNLD